MDFLASTCNNKIMVKNDFSLFIQDEVQGIFDHFCAAFGVRIIFCSPDGQILRAGLKRPDSAYCRLIQCELYGERRCAELDLERQAEAARKRKPLRYQCHAGLIEIIAPVSVGEQLIGFAIIGQIRRTRGMSAQVFKDWRVGHDPERLRRAFEELPFYEDRQIDHVAALMLVIIDYIVAREMIAYRGSILVESALAYLRANIDRNVSLDELAGELGKSVSTVTHTFSSILGKSFKQVAIDLKLDEAERLLGSLESPTVGDVAQRVGYEDQFQFSRIYKKHRGLAPTEYLRRASRRRAPAAPSPAARERPRSGGAAPSRR